MIWLLWLSLTVMWTLKPSSFEAANPILVPCVKNKAFTYRSDLPKMVSFRAHGTRIGVAASKLDGFSILTDDKLKHISYITRCQQYFSRTTSKSVSEPMRDVLDMVNHLCEIHADIALCYALIY